MARFIRLSGTEGGSAFNTNTRQAVTGSKGEAMSLADLGTAFNLVNTLATSKLGGALATGVKKGAEWAGEKIGQGFDWAQENLSDAMQDPAKAAQPEDPRAAAARQALSQIMAKNAGEGTANLGGAALSSIYKGPVSGTANLGGANLPLNRPGQPQPPADSTGTGQSIEGRGRYLVGTEPTQEDRARLIYLNRRLQEATTEEEVAQLKPEIEALGKKFLGANTEADYATDVNRDWPQPGAAQAEVQQVRREAAQNDALLRQAAAARAGASKPGTFVQEGADRPGTYKGTGMEFRPAPAVGATRPGGDPRVRNDQEGYGEVGTTSAYGGGYKAPSLVESAPAKILEGKAVLKPGTKGPFVQQVQEALAKRGFDVGNPDGVLGKKTTAALKAFQAANGLKPDGLVGKNTLLALSKPAEPPAQMPPARPQEAAQPQEAPAPTPQAPDATAGQEEAPATPAAPAQPMEYRDAMTAARQASLGNAPVEDRVKILQAFKASGRKGVNYGSLLDLLTGENEDRAEKELADQLSEGLPKNIDLLKLAEDWKKFEADQARRGREFDTTLAENKRQFGAKEGQDAKEFDAREKREWDRLEALKKLWKQQGAAALARARQAAAARGVQLTGAQQVAIANNAVDANVAAQRQKVIKAEARRKDLQKVIDKAPGKIDPNMQFMDPPGYSKAKAAEKAATDAKRELEASMQDADLQQAYRDVEVAERTKAANFSAVLGNSSGLSTDIPDEAPAGQEPGSAPTGKAGDVY